MRVFHSRHWCLWGCLMVTVLSVILLWWLYQYGPEASHYAGQIGMRAFKRHEYGTAERYFRKAGRNYQAWHAASLIKCRRPQDVKALYAEPLDYKSPEDDAVLGVAELELGRLDIALPWLEKAVTRAQKVPMHHLNLAIALERLGKLDSARQERAKAVNLGGTAYKHRYCPITCRLEMP